MYKIKNKFIILLATVLTLFSACQDLDELNINPNGVDPETAYLNLLLTTIETGIGQSVVRLGFGDIAGVMQHTQQDGWEGGHNNYDWGSDNQSWSGYYGILRNNDEFYNKAVDEGLEFHQGIALVMKAYTFGMITDLWGDAPFTEALQAEDGPENFQPAFDGQDVIYNGILADLETANTLLSKEQGAYSNINASQDVIYGGDVMKWQKFTNSLALRYYMRLSVKDPSKAAEGIGRITSNPDKYPLIVDVSDDANIGYIGASPEDSWPSNTVFDTDLQGAYFRLKMCSTLVETLQALNDPRLGVWANKIETPLKLVGGTEIDIIINGVRNISQDVVDAKYDFSNLNPGYVPVPDYDPEYVGITPSFIAAPAYNINPNIEQAVFNPHASQLNDIYKDNTGPLLQMRLMSAAEVHFILSEAALYGWGSGSPEGHYGAAIQQSFNAWGIGDSFGEYIVGAPYTGLDAIITQKWISSWSAATESWLDYRRTGLPNLQTGESAKRQALPLRFYYHFINEISLNTENANAAIDKLEPTSFKGSDPSNNSAWSKMWLLQGTGLPY